MKHLNRKMVSLLLSLLIVPAVIFADPSADGDALVDTPLPLPPDLKQQQYLGLTTQDEFKIPEIKSEVVIVEIFSMY